MSQGVALDVAILGAWSDRQADHLEIMLFGVPSSAHRLRWRSWTISPESLLLVCVVLGVSWVATLRSFSPDDLRQVDSSRRFGNVFDGSKIRA